MTPADLATVGDIQRVLARQDELDAKLDQILLALPPQFLDQKKTAKQLGVTVQTVTAMFKDGRLTGRRAGRRILIDSASLRPADPAAVARLALKARG